MAAKSHFIDGRWIEGTGASFESRDPATANPVWQGRAATADEVDTAVTAARGAAEAWAQNPLAERIAVLDRFTEQLKRVRADLSEAISLEIGKPRWESLTEVDAMINKVPISIDAYHQRRKPSEQSTGGSTVATRFKPHGVVAVFGPFNFPGHLPNGHIVPALLAGNTVVFKPSEAAPLVAQRTVQCWQDAGMPAGVLNLIQGARDTGAALAAHPGIDGVFFTGSAAVGLALRRALADHPDKILALEMGGNNPLIVHDVADLTAAAYNTIQSAFLTAGQRCTCARRLIVIKGETGDAFVDRLTAMTRTIRVGPFTQLPEPFIGPVISDLAGKKLLEAQQGLIRRGGRSLVEMRQVGDRGAMLSPGIVDVTGISQRADVEIFGPLLQLIRVDNFDRAIEEANNTRYGLSAGLLSDRRDLYDRFFARIRAGVVNWNRPITGASGSLPFGGIGHSGNHRPSGYYVADYCSYPIASMEVESLTLPASASPGITI